MTKRDVSASMLDVFVSALDAAGDVAEGRTVIQKWCFFTSVKLGLQFDFAPHHYGPYSARLSDMMTSLVTSDFLVERPRITKGGRTVYCYKLTDDGRALASEIEARSRHVHSTAKGVVQVCTDVVGNNIDILSWAAKVYFILTQEGRTVAYDEVCSLAEKLGWQLSDKEIDSAMKLLRALKLATVSKN